MSILSGLEIQKQIKAGRIEVEPFDPHYMNPASLDLTLGREVLVYHNVVDSCSPDYSPNHPERYFSPVRRNGVKGEGLMPRACQNPNRPFPGMTFRPNGYLDAAMENETIGCVLEPWEPFFLRPGIGYLMSVAERIRTDHYVPILDGKSSIGRLFAVVHVTAGFGDPGFDGQFTLEVQVTHPLIVYPGQRCCQVRFETIEGEVSLYQGNYTGDAAKGSVSSRAWKQIEKDRAYLASKAKPR
jgi:deoxycytidine triphosphate deaminase